MSEREPLLSTPPPEDEEEKERIPGDGADDGERAPKETDPLLTTARTLSPTPEDSEDLRYGCPGVKPACLQRFNTVLGYCTVLCLCSLSHSIVTMGLPGIVMTTLEKRFGLTSSQSSWIVSAFEVATIPSLILITVLGPR